MKKKLLFMITILFLLPCIVNAKEYCKVVSGNGKDTGSEIACGNEHFNIISSNENEIRMLAKYNLDVGENIYKEPIEKDEGDTRTDEQYCYDLAISKGGTARKDVFYNAPGYCFIAIPVNNIPGSEPLPYTSSHDSSPISTYECNQVIEALATNDENYNYIYDHRQGKPQTTCYYKKIAKKLNQNEESISAHWNENDEFLYPQMGDVYVTGVGDEGSSVQSDLVFDENSSEKYDGYFWDLSVRDKSQFSYILSAYTSTMNPYGITGINLITLEDVNKIIMQNNKSLSYEDIYNASLTAQPPRYEFAFLQDYLTKQQDFLFNTTYWLRTGYNKDYQDELGVNNVVFIDSRGGICGSTISREQNYIIAGNCSYKIELQLKSSVGIGIRPVVTIPNESVEYQIKTLTDGNGEIEVVDSSLGGEEITFKVTAKKGLKLKSIIVRTDSDEEIEFREEDIYPLIT